MADLSYLARAADRESLPARTAWAVSRVLLGRAHEASAVLVDVAASAPPLLQARAHAVRAWAEGRAGHHDRAARLIASARRLAPDDALVRLAGAEQPTRG